MRESDFGSVEAGIRFLDGIRDGVATAVTVLGTGFARHPDNSAVPENIGPQAMKRALLRLVYRLLLWMAAGEPGVQDRAAPDGTPGDLWPSVRLALDGLGELFAETGADRALRGLSLQDECLLAAVRSLRPVQTLSSEDLGVIGQSLLELDPGWGESGRAFTLTPASGGKPASTGAYYIPAALVDCLLDTALDPVLDAAAGSGDAEQALLSVTVCDPACGSGQFLVAAARRIARRVAAAREHNPEPPADTLRQALRDVVGNCVFGVDLSDMTVELAKACLWLESAEPGMPLTFIGGHVKQGNSLIGVTPGLIDNGIPDSAFQPVEGDDPKFARSLRRANGKPSPGQITLFSDQADDTRPDETLVADAWCAAFTWTKHPDAPRPIVNRGFADLREQGPAGILPETLAEIERLREEHRFFHWHLEFPGVFANGGFSCVVTNPPRDVVDRRAARAAFAFARGSGAYPQCAKGLATRGVTALRADQLFTERLTTIVAPEGRAGCALAAGGATSQGGEHLFGSLTRRGALASRYDFASCASGNRTTRFCLLTLVGRGSRVDAPRYAFSLRDPAELADSGRAFPLTAAEISLISPNTGTLPAFRDRRGAALTTAVYRRVPVLWDEARAGGNPWRMGLAPNFFRIRTDSGMFRTQQALLDEGWDLAGNVFTRGTERMLPVYEATMAHHFDHRCGQPRYWVAEDGPVSERLRKLGWARGWLCGWRESPRPEDERTAVAAFLPRAAVAESFPLMLPRAVPPFVAGLIAAQSSLVFDFVARQKLDGAKMRPVTWKQLPVPTPEMMEPHLPFIVPRVLELVYTADDMAPLARDLDDDGDPFAWDPDRRAELRAELDAFFFRLYGIDDRDDVDYILGSFPNESGKLILGAYDRMAAAADADSVYETRIVPFPGHGRRADRP